MYFVVVDKYGTRRGIVHSQDGISTDNAIARFHGTSGHRVQNSGATINDEGNLAAGGVSVSAKLTLGRSTLTIAAGVITATRSYHLVETEAGAASDDLDTIAGGADGMILVLMAYNNAHTVVIKDNTGNLVTAGDFSMDDYVDTIMLFWNSARGKWLELSRSSN